MATDDIFRVTFQWTQPTLDVAQLVFHYRQTTPGTIDPATALADLGTAFLVGWDLLSDRVGIGVEGDQRSIALYDPVAEEFNTIGSLVMGAAFDGVGTGAIGGFQEAICIKFFTEVAKSIGKKFLFGLLRDQITTDVVETGAVAEALAAGLIWAQPVETDGITLVPGNWVRATGGFRDWTGDVSVKLASSSQDSRRSGFGL